MDSESLLFGRHAAVLPSRNAMLTPYERAVLSVEIPSEDPAIYLRKGVKGWAKISETQNRSPKSIRELKRLRPDILRPGRIRPVADMPDYFRAICGSHVRIGDSAKYRHVC